MRRSLGAFWRRAYDENITGMAGMVAYNLMLSVFPFALLVLFVFGQILSSTDIETSVIRDLQQLFPETERAKLSSELNRIRTNSTEIGIVAIVAGVWIGASFWGAMDTAFCRIYHVRCRAWLEQKRFSLIMLGVVTLFLAASVSVPALEGLVLAGVEDLPLGLSDAAWIARLAVIAGGLAIGFLMLCLIYWAVPKGRMPWRGVWPGALFVTFAGGIANIAFPFYLVNLSTIGQFGRIVSFVVVALIWFYLLALGLLAGGVINALRYELHDTGTLRGMTAQFPAQAEAEVPEEPTWGPDRLDRDPESERQPPPGSDPGPRSRPLTDPAPAPPAEDLARDQEDPPESGEAGER